MERDARDNGIGRWKRNIVPTGCSGSSNDTPSSRQVTATAASVPGAETSSFIAPLITGISLFTVVTLFIVALSPTEDELLEDADFDERLDRLTRGREQSYENFAG